MFLIHINFVPILLEMLFLRISYSQNINQKNIFNDISYNRKMII